MELHVTETHGETREATVISISDQVGFDGVPIYVYCVLRKVGWDGVKKKLFY